MSKLFRTLALTALLAGATSAVTVAPAQEKGKPAKKEDDDKKAPAKKAKKATGSVEVLETKTGKWYFKVLDADGKMLAMSATSKYAEKADCVKAFEELKEVLESAKVSYPAKKADDDDKDDKKEKKEMKKEKKG